MGMARYSQNYSGWFLSTKKKKKTEKDILKKKKKKKKKNFTNVQCLFLLFSFYYVSYMTILIALVLLSSFQFLQVILLLSERCSTMRGVHPPSFQGQLINFHLRALDHCLQQETKKKGQHYCNEKGKTVGWWDSYDSPQGWIIKVLLAGETLNIFLQTVSESVSN